jgi:hypothetical protein
MCTGNRTQGSTPAFIVVTILAVAAATHSESIYFPHVRGATSDISGVVDISKSPYNIRPSTGADVTAALQQVLDEHQFVCTIYFPNGTYLVSNTLTYLTCANGYCDGSRGSRGPYLQGQSRAGTVIRLKDSTWPNGTEKKAVDRPVHLRNRHPAPSLSVKIVDAPRTGNTPRLLGGSVRCNGLLGRLSYGCVLAVAIVTMITYCCIPATQYRFSASTPLPVCC